MSKQTFTANQVLTAAQMNTLQQNDYNQTVSTKTASYTLVAADAGTQIAMNSASATTITVNTSLFIAGDSLTISNIGSGVTTVLAGTATVSSAGPLAVPQYGGGRLVFTSTSAAIYYPSAVTAAAASGLTLITSGTVSAGATVSIVNAFSTTYDFYSMRFSNFQMASDNVTINLQLGSSGSAYTGNDYYTRGFYASDSAVAAVGSAVGIDNFRLSIADGTTRNGLFLELSAPFLSSATFFTASGIGNYSGAVYGSGLSGVLKTNTSYTDMFFSSNSGNIGPFTFALFGYAK